MQPLGFQLIFSRFDPVTLYMIRKQRATFLFSFEKIKKPHKAALHFDPFFYSVVIISFSSVLMVKD